MDGGKKGTEGMDKDIVIDGGLEGSDVGSGVVDNVTVERDEAEEVLIYKFFLQVPKLLVILVNNCVLVQVVVGSGSTDGGGKELRKEGGGNGVGRQFNRKKWERSGWLWSGGTGRWFVVDGGCHGRSPCHLETQSKPLRVLQELPLNQAIAKWLSDVLLSL